jgi:hypothetical protein
MRSPQKWLVQGHVQPHRRGGGRQLSEKLGEDKVAYDEQVKCLKAADDFLKSIDLKGFLVRTWNPNTAMAPQTII